jgi:hypothetical protein
LYFSPNLTVTFLKIKIDEYDQLKKEIKSLSNQVDKIDPALREDLKI